MDCAEWEPGSLACPQLRKLLNLRDLPFNRVKLSIYLLL